MSDNGKIAYMCTEPKSYFKVFGPWWWSSGHSAYPQLGLSEFESC